MKNDIMLINKYAVKELFEKDVFTFSIILCDNELDRDNERFSTETLYELKELYLGKTGIFDHKHLAKNQVARIYSTEIVKDKDRKTIDNEEYCYLKARAYMVKSSENNLLIKEIESGIKKEVSVGCSVKRVLCSVCQTDLKIKTCQHQLEKSGAHRILDGVKDVYEWSFVAVPAQKEAGVVKKFFTRENQGGHFDYDSLEDLKKDAKAGREYKESLKKDIIKENFLNQEKVPPEIIKGIIEKLSFEELIIFKNSFIEKTPEVQLKQSQAEKKNNSEYRLRSV